MGDLDEAGVTAIFDQLVAEGILVYGSHESIIREAEGYPVSALSQMKQAGG